MHAEDAENVRHRGTKFSSVCAPQYHKVLRLIGVCYYVYHQKLFVSFILLTIFSHT